MNSTTLRSILLFSFSSILTASFAGLATAQDVFPLRQYGHAGAIPGNVRAICRGDFNLDGREDVATANGFNGSVEVFYGQVDGTLSFPTTIPLQNFGDATGITSADLDGDGNLDFAVCIENSDVVETYLNDGAGGFNHTTTMYCPSIPLRLLSGKLDHVDNIPDLVVLCGYTEEIVVFHGDGLGGLIGPVITQPFGGIPHQLGDMAIADLNSDSVLDIAVTDVFAGQFWTGINNGSGTFTGVSTITLPTGSNPVSLAIGQLNTDTILDIVVLDQGTSRAEVYPGLGGGTISNVPSAARNDGAYSMASRVAIADYNNDGLNDFAVAFFENSGRALQVVYQNSSSYSFGYEGPGGNELYLACGPEVYDFTLADVNGDGFDDLVVPAGTWNSPNGLTVALRNNGGFDFDVPSWFYASPVTNTAVLADFNGNGKPDIASSDQFDRILLSYDYYNAPPGIQPSTLFDAPNSVGSPMHMDSGDFNLDGRPDLVTANFNGTIAFLKNNGTGGPAAGFDAPTYTNVGSQIQHLAVCDTNLDGIPDVLVPEQLSHEVRVFLGTGTGSFTAGPVVNGGGNLPSEIATGDLNMDGFPDFACTLEFNSQTLIGMGGPGGFPTVTSYLMGAGSGSGSRAIAINDYDRDFNLDIVVTNMVDGLLGIRQGSASGTFGTLQLRQVGGGATAVAMTDVTGDGYADIVTAQWGVEYRNIGLWQNDGAGGFFGYRTFATLFAQTLSKIGLSTGDVNGDGHTDLLVSAGFQGLIYLNKQPQPTGMTQTGTGTAWCRGRIGMSANGPAVINSPASFGFTATNAPPRSLGLGIATEVADQAGSDPFGFGIIFHNDFIQSVELYSFDFISDASGNAFAPAAIGNNPLLQGLTYYLQSLWVNPAASLCNPSVFGLASSQLLNITIQ